MKYNFIYLYLIFIVVLSVAMMLIVLCHRIYVHFTKARFEKRKDQWRDYYASDNFVGNQDAIYEKLKQVKQLVAFEAVIQELKNMDSQADKVRLNDFRSSIYPVWVALGKSYLKRPLIYQAYFAYISCLLPFHQVNHDTKSLEAILLKIVAQDSAYCQNYAFNTLNKIGNADTVIQALKVLNNSKGIPLNTKLISSSLLSFTGDFDLLFEKIISSDNVFNTHYRVALVDFAKLIDSPDFSNMLLPYLKNKDENVDLTCAILRYYAKVHVDKAYPYILKWADTSDVREWACAGVATSTLAHYPGPATIDQLKNNIFSREWYIRRNASIALSELAVAPSELSIIFNGDDPYAKEQLIYYYDQKGLSHGC